MKTIITFFISLFIAGTLQATNYYCNPTIGDINNDGSSNNPWSTLSDVFNAGKEFNTGDTIFAYSGEHGNVEITQSNADYVVISAAKDQTPILSGLIINNASYWKFIGIDISRSTPSENYNVYYVSDEYFLVQTTKASSNLYFEECNIYTANVDVANWTRLDWYTGVLSGFILRGKYNIIENCTIKNTNFSIEVRGRYTEMTNTTIENFVGDAIRALSSYSKYEYNTVKNSYDITGYDDNSNGQNPDYPTGGGNHDDLFQSYTSSVGGAEYTVTDVVVRYNKFYSYTDNNQVDKSYTQGIACFDGFFNNWTIENNLVVTDSWHGITMLGVNNIAIANNTIINNPIDNDLVLGNGAAVNDMTPFIWVGKTKSGDKSYDNIVRNNLIIKSKFGASGYNNIIDDGENTIIQNNHTIPEASTGQYFVDFENLDFHTFENSPAIDQGININLLPSDIDSAKRLMGPMVDCGAYEFDNSTEGNNCPSIEPIEKQQVEEYNTLDITITTINPDASFITMNVDSLDNSFMTFIDNGDGSGVLTLKPQQGDVGEYKLGVVVEDDKGNTNLQTIVVEVLYGSVTMLNETRNDIEVYPNPVLAGENIHIKGLTNQSSGIVDITIYNILGVKVYSEEQKINNNEFILNTNSIKESGTYILSIEGYNKTFQIH